MSQLVIDRPLAASARRLVLAHLGSVPRIALGGTLVACAVPKFAGISIAAVLSSRGTDVAAAAVERMSFGGLAGHTSLLVAATLETLVGLLLVIGRTWRVGLVLLVGALVAVLSPLVVFVDHFLPVPIVRQVLAVGDLAFAALAMLVTTYALRHDHDHDQDQEHAPTHDQG